MKKERPLISVIIPTHNRRADLERTLGALKIQTYPMTEVEVIVVADGSTDGTLEMLKDYRAPFTLNIIARSHLGPGAARNCGACSATAPLLLFLDDDVEPTPALIGAHVRAHHKQKGHVVIGPYPPIYQDNSYIHIQIRSWWEKTFHAMLQRGHRFAYSDILTGNMSIEADLFRRLGGFNPALKAHEDYEFGMRLIKSQVPITAAPDAAGRHHDRSDLGRSFRRKFEEGRADVMMARLHPEFRQALPLAWIAVRRLSLEGILLMIAFSFPAAGRALAAILRAALISLEKARLRSRWKQLCTILQRYWYWRGAASELGTLRKLRDILEDSLSARSRSASLTELDLREGLQRAELRLDIKRPSEARIRFGNSPIGIIHAQPGAEALRGAHLRPFLAQSMAVPLLHAMALEGLITGSKTIDRERLAKSLRVRSRWFGPTRPKEMWFEQYSQWKAPEKELSASELALKNHWDRIVSLEYETARLEEERLYWTQLAERQER